MQPGDRILVKAFKADGRWYRRWSAAVESFSQEGIVVVTPAGHRVEEPGGGRNSSFSIRGYYWFGAWHSLLEAYNPAGRLAEIYVNINSPVVLNDDFMAFTDYELDVSRIPPGIARIVDQDEFAQAVTAYGCDLKL